MARRYESSAALDERPRCVYCGETMKKSEVLRAWSRILGGRQPSLSIEITKECPLRCPGCYAFDAAHLGGSTELRQLSDFKGDQLVSRVLALLDEHKPLHVSLVGGDPLVRHRELELLLPEIEKRGIHTQIVTSAFRVIPGNWTAFKKLNVVVSIDGLQPEHDARRKPATYERILKNIQGARITVHCTITSQIAGRPGYLDQFLEFWSGRPEVVKVWFSLFTPQRGSHRSRDPDASAKGLRDSRPSAIAGGVSRSRNARIIDSRDGKSTQQPKGVHLCKNYSNHLGRSENANHALPVRRRSGLRPVRLYRIDGVGRRWPSPRVGWAHRRTDFQRFRAGRQRIEDHAKKTRKANAVPVRTLLVPQGATHHKNWQNARLKHLSNTLTRLHAENIAEAKMVHRVFFASPASCAGCYDPRHTHPASRAHAECRKGASHRSSFPRFEEE